jgi:hypothetical protein
MTGELLKCQPWEKLATETLARLKMKFLGINRRNYIQIRGFHGTDSAKIDRQIAEIVCKVGRFATAGERAASKD